ncbi:bifunctional serine/threonine-protein kinase/formylglycine-generating enzyme family protein [Polyangium fumosum]|nr:bifunctional serine/threonine-protein kinase/formylglycine-generating enzyme family protein [Polyangium fumosum]
MATGEPSCRRCGAVIGEKARFCADCGAPVAAAPDPTVLFMKVPSALAPTTPVEQGVWGHSSARPSGAPNVQPEPTPASAQPNSRLPPMRIPSGTVLSGVYAVQNVLGEGGMGVVYRAHDGALGRTVAIKCLHSNLAGDAEIRRRFVREARVLRTFSHPHVVSVFDLIEHEHLLGIVMEHVEGQTLAHHLVKWRGRMPFVEIREIFIAVLDAMDAAHRQGIIHRDLKPDNVLVMRGPAGELVPKVVDFGIARILEGTTYTVSGALLGTCRYMSPEQVKGDKTADHRSDIYSLGVSLYELAAGRPPFPEDNHFALMMSHVQAEPPKPSQHRAEIPTLLEDLILSALAKNAAERPQTCAEFRERLLAAIDEPTPGHVAVRPTSTSVPPLATVLRDTDGAESVLVPAGSFLMGPDRREVFLDAYYIDRAPVTNRQFALFVQVTGYKPVDESGGRFLAHWARGVVPRGLEEHPVVNVSWDDACAYASWAGKRLPTEAEWEKAARGTDGRRYPWGKAEPTPSRAHYGGKHRGTSPVGSYPEGQSPYGALDMAGNVWEWCEDVDDPAFYTDGPSRNPKNTARPPHPLYVMRGGSWLFGAQSLKTYSRTRFEPHYRFAGGGFRCVRSAR